MAGWGLTVLVLGGRRLEEALVELLPSRRCWRCGEWESGGRVLGVERRASEARERPELGVLVLCGRWVGAEGARHRLAVAARVQGWLVNRTSPSSKCVRASQAGGEGSVQESATRQSRPDNPTTAYKGKKRKFGSAQGLNGHPRATAGGDGDDCGGRGVVG